MMAWTGYRLNQWLLHMGLVETAFISWEEVGVLEIDESIGLRRITQWQSD